MPTHDSNVSLIGKSLQILFQNHSKSIPMPWIQPLNRSRNGIDNNYLFRVHSRCICHKVFSFMMSLLAMTFWDRLCFSRKAGIGGGGWVHPKGANSMATSGHISRSDLVGTGRAISVLSGVNGVRNKQSHLVGPPFPASKAGLLATASWPSLEI